MTREEEQFYEIAGKEIATNNHVKGILVKAFSEADGNKERAAALYIKYRVEQLKEDWGILVAEEANRRQKEIAEKAREAQKALKAGKAKKCPRCNAILPVNFFQCNCGYSFYY